MYSIKKKKKKPMCFAGDCSLQFERGVMFPLASEVQIKKRRKQGSAKCCRVDFCACRKKTGGKNNPQEKTF